LKDLPEFYVCASCGSNGSKLIDLGLDFISRAIRRAEPSLMLQQSLQLEKGTRPASGIQTGLMDERQKTWHHPFSKNQREKIAMLKATENNRWISHITPILTVAELNEFILLWEGITSVARNENSEDEIIRKWTPDGQYTTQSAYQI
jgi:hypothetical protein